MNKSIASPSLEDKIKRVKNVGEKEKNKNN